MDREELRELSEEEEHDDDVIGTIPDDQWPEAREETEKMDSLQKIKWGYSDGFLFQPDLGISVQCDIVGYDEEYFHVFMRKMDRFIKLMQLKRDVNLIIGIALDNFKDKYVSMENMRTIQQDIQGYT